MDNALETSSQRIRNHLRRPIPGRGELLNEKARNTVNEIVPSTMQIELLNRKKWKTRIELANAIFEFIEVFYQRQRRHSKIGYISPVEFEVKMQQQPA